METCFGKQYDGTYRYKYHLQEEANNVYVVQLDVRSRHVAMIKEHFTD